MTDLAQRIATELEVAKAQVAAAIALLDEGATVPFIARYRKEATGGLDDTQLRTLHERLAYLRELEERREVILKSIDEQGKLSKELKADLLEADTKTRLEDLYLPYKPKRRTKGQIAVEAGLEPLAEQLFGDPTQQPEALAIEYIDAEKGVADAKAALDGAKYILMERFAENANLLASLRHYLSEHAQLRSKVIEGQEKNGDKFSDYFDRQEAFKSVPSHRALALFRGRKEGILTLSLEVEDDSGTSAKRTTHPCEHMIAKHYGIEDQQRAADTWLKEVVRWTWRVKLLSHLETELLGQLREAAEKEAINVFSKNLSDLLMAAPAGPKVTLGLDPGLRTGVKVAIVDTTGRLLDHTTLYPHAPKNQWLPSMESLATLCKQHAVSLISIGNGTASRETDKWVTEMLKAHKDIKAQHIVTSEAGASVYSASELAAREFPDLDVSFRGAVSIARRLQDPLAELVKIEPKAIGVGQYQHDVNQSQLARSLDAVIEDCVNAVGVDVNTASSPLLSRISGLNATIADNIVQFRDKNGRFGSREELTQVPRLGAKTFEQAAGFLRIMDGSNPLDRSAVHPEAYSVVEAIAARQQRDIDKIIGDQHFLKTVSANDYTNDTFGEPTVIDIIKELEKPGRDPRPEFKTATFKEGVEKIADLKPDMVLEGVVTNVTNFGAFVDIGVHQDGLVHISQLANKFVSDPREVVKAGDVVKVKVMEADADRKRIGLTMRLDQKAPPQDNAQPRSQPAKRTRNGGAKSPNTRHSQQSQTSQGGKATLADIFANAKPLRKK